MSNTASTTKKASTGRTGRVVRTAAAVTTAGAILAAGTVGWAQTRSNEPDGPSTPQQINMYDSPAVSLVVSRETARVTWRLPVPNIDALVSFANTDPAAVAAYRQGSYEAASADIVQELLRNPAAYLRLGRSTSSKQLDGSMGTGWGVSSNGYFVTNHHVVAPIDRSRWIAHGTEESEDRPAAVDQIVSTLEDRVTDIHWASHPLTVTPAEEQALANLARVWLDRTSTVSDHTQQVTIGGGQSVATQDAGMPARIVSTSKHTWPRSDVAILKVDATNLPTIPLGNDTTLQVGDSVHALGYPGDASFGSGLSDRTTVTATMSSGQVTNRLRSTDGFSAIENTATTNHGNSGGPLVDGHGRVVGIVTAIDPSTDSSTSINGGKFFYAVPISEVRKYLREQGITSLAAPDQARYEHAMDLMRDSHYSAALEELKVVEAHGFSSDYVRMHAQMARADVAAGRDVPVHDRRTIGAGVLGVLGVLAAAAAALLRRRNGAPAPADSPAAEQVAGAEVPPETGAPVREREEAGV